MAPLDLDYQKLVRNHHSQFQRRKIASRGHNNKRKMQNRIENHPQKTRIQCRASFTRSSGRVNANKETTDAGYTWI